MRNQRIGVLMGGLSSEKAVSLDTGTAVHAALVELGYDAHPIFVDRDVDLVLRQNPIDVAFIALHGRYGEDGCIQGLLETLGIPYTGSDVLASALAMNKLKAKEIFRLHNLPTPPCYVLTRDQLADPLAAHGDFGFPVVVKPIGEGSSVGVELVSGPDDFLAACENAFCFDSSLMVERFVQGQEVSVAILGERALGAVEIVPKHGFYDYGSKYTSGASEYYIPPRLSPERYRGVMTQAVRAHRALGCSGATRVDAIISEAGNEYLLEVNTIPGLTPTSLLPKIASYSGLSFSELVQAILHGAKLSATGRFERRDRRRGNDPRTYVGVDRRSEAEHQGHH